MPIAVCVLALASFAIGTAEFVISGILPPLAADLAVTIPTAGLLVTAYAMGVAVAGPFLSIYAARFSPRTVLIAVMALFALSQLLCSLAANYEMLLLARLLSACGHGVFFGAGNVVVAGLVPAERRGAAFSLFIGGITVANLLGLPAGSAIGVAFGWRATFLAVAALGVVALLAIIWRLPPLPRESHEQASVGAQIRALRHHQVWMSYLTIATVMVGALVFGTYQVAMLLGITHVDPAIVPFYLLLSGLGAVIGIYAGGQLTDWRPMPSLIAVLLLQAVCYAAMIFSLTDKVYVAINMFATGMAGFAFSTPLQARVITAAREAPNLASALISTAFNLGIAGGAFLGAMLLNAGVRLGDLPAVGVCTALLAAIIAFVSWRLDKRVAPATAAASA